MVIPPPLPPEFDLAIQILVHALVDHPDDVKVTRLETDYQTTLHVRVHPSDIGKLVGASGRTARSLRIIFTACAKKYGRAIALDIEDKS